MDRPASLGETAGLGTAAIRERLRHPFDLSGDGSLLLLVVMLAAGVLGNLLSLSMFFGVDIIFGSIATIIIARRFGPVFGALGAFLISLYTLQLWGHPYALIIFTLEGLLVGLLSRRDSSASVVHVDVAFWLLVGMPLAWFFYSVQLGLSSVPVQLILLKQGFNGIGNAIVAMVLYQFVGMRLTRWSKAAPGRGGEGLLRLGELPTIIVALAVLLPVMLVISLVGRGTLGTAQLNNDLQLGLMVDRLKGELDQSLRNYTESGRAEVSRFLAGEIDAADLDRSIDLYIGARRLAGLLVYRDDGSRVHMHMRPGRDPVLESALPDAAELAAGADYHRAYAIDDGQVTYLGVVARARGGFTLTLVEIAVLIDGAIFGNERERGVALELRSRDGDLLIAYDIDGVLGRSVMTSRVEGREMMLLVPDDPRLSTVARWRGTYLMQEVDLGRWDGGTMRLRVASSMADSIDQAQGTHVGIIMIGLLVILVAVVLSPLMMGAITRPLERMVAAASQLGDDLDADVEWPHAVILELEVFRQQFVKLVERMKESVRETESLIDGSNAPIFGTGLDGRINVWNRAMAELTGVEREAALGRDLVEEFAAEGMDEALRCSIADALDGIEREPFEMSLRCPDGPAVSLLMNWTRRHDLDGKLSGVVGIAQDIRARMEAESLMMRTSRLASLGEMSTSVAHEINQPLNVIRLAAGNIRRRAEADALQHEYLIEKLDRIRNAVVRAAGIIDHMRIFGRKDMLGASRFDPRSSITSALQLVGERNRVVGLVTESDFEDGEMAVFGDPVLFEQAILAIIENARDAYAGKAGTIHIGAARAPGGRVRITIRDRAGGIKESVLGRIFEPFFTTKEVGQGPGMGLAVCYGSISDMGGSIQARNVDGGAEFEILLPLVESGPESEDGGPDA